jgi:hypothetical protein
MDFELQTICVIRPAYFTVIVLLTIVATIASGISGVIATIRRMRGEKIVSANARKLHVAVILVWVTYAVVVGVGMIRDRQFLRDYERTRGKAAPAVREALNRETGTVITVGAGCAAVILLSMLAWRDVASRGTHDHIA